MKKLIMVLLVIMVSHGIMAQAPPLPQIVVSPQLFSPLSSMEELQERLNKLRTSAGFLVNLGSFQKFASVIEQTRCSTQNLQNLIAQLEGRNSKFLNTCRFEIQFNTGVYRLKSVADMTNSLLSSLSLDPGDRLKLTLDTMAEFDNVQIKLLDLTDELENELVADNSKEMMERDGEWALRNLY